MIEAVIVQITGDVDDDFGMIWGGSSLYDTNVDGAVGIVNASGTALTNIATGGSQGAITSPGLIFGYLEDGNLICCDTSD